MKTLRYALLLVTLFALAPRVEAQPVRANISYFARLEEVAVSAMPLSNNWVGRMFIVNDATGTGDCADGGSSFSALCYWDGSAWVALGGGAVSFTDLSGRIASSQLPSGMTWSTAFGNLLSVDGSIVAGTTSQGNATMGAVGFAVQRFSSDTVGATFNLQKLRGAGAALDGDNVGTYKYTIYNDNIEITDMVSMNTVVEDNTDGTEDAYWEFYAMRGGALTRKLRIDDVVTFDGDSYFDMEANAAPGAPDTDWNRFGIPAEDSPLCQYDDTGTELGCYNRDDQIIDGDTQILQVRRASDCTAETGGKSGEFCMDTDDASIRVCLPLAGDCDAANEWVTVGGSYRAQETLFFRSDAGQPSGVECSSGYADVAKTANEEDPDYIEWEDGVDEGGHCVLDYGVVPGDTLTRVDVRYQWAATIHDGGSDGGTNCVTTPDSCDIQTTVELRCADESANNSWANSAHDEATQVLTFDAETSGNPEVATAIQIATASFTSSLDVCAEGIPLQIRMTYDSSGTDIDKLRWAWASITLHVTP